LIKRRLNVTLTKFKRYSNVFLRRLFQRHVTEIRQAAVPHLSFCRSTAIIHYLSSFTLQIVLLRSLDLRRYLGKFCALYKSFFRKSTPSDTAINLSGIGWCLKDAGTA